MIHRSQSPNTGKSFSIRESRINEICSNNDVILIIKEGAVGFSVLRIWPISFGSVFGFLLLEIAVFRFWCFVRFPGFLQFSLWFSVFVSNDGGFSDSSASAFNGFSGFAKDVASCSHAKTQCNSKRPLTVGGMHDKPNLLSSPEEVR